MEEDWLRREWAKTGKKLDMGKCCVRFKKLEDLALEVIGQAIKRVTAREYIANYVQFLQSHTPKKRSEIKKAVAKKTAAKKAALKKKTAKSVAAPKAKKKSPTTGKSPKKHR